jgi:hypothetical protein
MHRTFASPLPTLGRSPRRRGRYLARDTVARRGPSHSGELSGSNAADQHSSGQDRSDSHSSTGAIAVTTGSPAAIALAEKAAPWDLLAGRLVRLPFGPGLPSPTPIGSSARRPLTRVGCLDTRCVKGHRLILDNERREDVGEGEGGGSTVRGECIPEQGGDGLVEGAGAASGGDGGTSATASAAATSESRAQATGPPHRDRPVGTGGLKLWITPSYSPVIARRRAPVRLRSMLQPDRAARQRDAARSPRPYLQRLASPLPEQCSGRTLASLRPPVSHRAGLP